MYKGEADWTHIAAVKEMADIHIPIFGNGDIDSPEKALEYRRRYGVDGIMIGRAAIGYPWIFNEIKHFMATGQHLQEPSLEERVESLGDIWLFLSSGKVSERAFSRCAVITLIISGAYRTSSHFAHG